MIVAALAAFAAPLRADDDGIEVKVVAVLASSDHTKIDERLKGLAPELKKKDASWTGFEVDFQSKKPMKIGESATFPLVDKVDVPITLKGRDEDGCVTLLIKPPTLGEIKYTCCCGKYFPIVTRYETKDKKRLVIAIMVQPCAKKKPEGDKKPPKKPPCCCLPSGAGRAD
jgi:hypothetical protein